MNPLGSDPSDREPQGTLPGPHGRARKHYEFTPDEIRVFRECNRESFFQRCVPISTILGMSTFYAVKAGYLKPNRSFGPTPKVMGAMLIGYFIGKFSYQSKCAEKLMQLPNSRVGDILRQRRLGNVTETLDSGFGPGMSLTPFSGVSSSDTYSDLQSGPKSSLDIDTTRPDQHELDDNYRPSLDSNPIYEEEMPPVQKHSTTYDELRKKNREEYQNKRMGNYREPIRSVSPQTQPQSPLSEPKNKYGDVWE